VDAKGAAEIVTRLFFPVSRRSIPDWACWQDRIFINGRSTMTTQAVIDEARLRLANATARRPYAEGRGHQRKPAADTAA
jgi:hypothetical protein